MSETIPFYPIETRRVVRLWEIRWRPQFDVLSPGNPGIRVFVEWIKEEWNASYITYQANGAWVSAFVPLDELREHTELTK